MNCCALENKRSCTAHFVLKKKESQHSKMLGTAALTRMLHRAKHRGPCSVGSWPNVPHARNGTTRIAKLQSLTHGSPSLCGRQARWQRQRRWARWWLWSRDRCEAEGHDQGHLCPGVDSLRSTSSAPDCRAGGKGSGGWIGFPWQRE